MKSYQHTQFGSASVLGGGAIGFALMLIAAFSSHAALPLLAGGVVLLVGVVLFSTLTITIEEGMLRASFGPGLIRKKASV